MCGRVVHWRKDEAAEHARNARRADARGGPGRFGAAAALLFDVQKRLLLRTAK